MEYASTHGANMAPIGIALVEPQAEIIRLNGLKKSADRSPRPASQRRKRSQRRHGRRVIQRRVRAQPPRVTNRRSRSDPHASSRASTRTMAHRARRVPAAKSRPRPRQAATVATTVAMPSVETFAIPCDAGSSLDPANSGVEMRLPAARPSVSPENTVFVSLCFEGPDHYATAGGLGTRVAALTETLATQGYETHLIYVGDPGLPPVERRVDGQLHLKRWC